MINIKHFSLFLIFAALLCSCDKVIDIKLNNSATKYVVEGVVTNEAGGAQVLLSQTKNFSDNNDFNGVDGATITIEGNGALNVCTAAGNGVYQANTLIGVPGNTYKLTINIKGNTFTATCTMPQIVTLDSVYVTTDNLNTNKDGSIRKYATVEYKDPASVKNYYRFIQYLNGKKEKSIFVNNDEFTNGQEVNNPLSFNNDNDDPARNIKKGDKLNIDMLCIDEAIYKYWYSLVDGASGNSNTASPSNPVGNIQGGALGYFSAHTIQHKVIIAP